MDWVFRGKVVWKFGDNFNSDLITEYPRYKSVSNTEELSRICMIGIDPEFPNRVKKGDLMIAGKNFGFGHPHSQTHKALKASGVSSVIAESFARGWFRAAISLGLPALPCEGIAEKARSGDELQVNFRTGEVKNLTTGVLINTEPLPQFMLDIIEAKGLVQYLKKTLKKNKNQR